MIEWDIRVESRGAPGRCRAAILEAGQAHVVVVADAGAAEAASAALRHVEARGPSLREAGNPGHWCRVLGDLDRALEEEAAVAETAAVVVAVLFDTLAGASVGDSGALLFDADRFDDLTSGQAAGPRLGSGRARPAGFGPLPFRGTLVVATRGLLGNVDATRIWGCLAHTTVAEAAEALAGLVRAPSGELPDDLALAVVRPR